MRQKRKPWKAVTFSVSFASPDDPIARPPRPNVPIVNVSAIRAKAGMSQSAFAASIGVPLGTLINWEQGRRQPTGAAKVLLALLAKNPSLVGDLYPAPRQKTHHWTPGSPDPSEMTAKERLAEIGEILANGVARMLKKSAEHS
jgi:putative transcriptional regulator